MGILSKSTKFTMLEFSGDINLDNLEESINQNCFEEMTEEDDSEQSMGWVNIDNPTNNLFQKNSYNYVQEGETYIPLTLRIDSRKVPKQALQDYLYKLAKQKGNKLSKDEKEAASSYLLKKSIPKTKLIDVVSCLSKEMVYVFTNNEKDIETISEIYKNTFGISTTRLFTYNKALKILDKPVIDGLRPTLFSDNINVKMPESKTSEDNASLLIEKRFIGQEFLIWLWYISNREEKDIEKLSDFYLGDKIVLEVLAQDGRNEKVSCCFGEMQEAREALKKGKRITSMAINIESNNSNDFTVILDDKFLDIKGKTPKIEIVKDNFIEAFLEKMYLIHEMSDLIFNMFKKFIEIRSSDKWNYIVNDIIKEIKG